MIIDLIGMALLVLFCFFFKNAYSQFMQTLDYSKGKEFTEQQMAAAFIRASIDIYEHRHARPDQIDPVKFDKACEHLDDLVEQYYLSVEKAAEDQNVVRLGAVKI